MTHRNEIQRSLIVIGITSPLSRAARAMMATSAASAPAACWAAFTVQDLFSRLDLFTIWSIALKRLELGTVSSPSIETYFAGDGSGGGGNGAEAWSKTTTHFPSRFVLTSVYRRSISTPAPPSEGTVSFTLPQPITTSPAAL